MADANIIGKIARNPLSDLWVMKRMIHRIDPTHPPHDFKEGKFVIFLGGGKASGKTTLLHLLFKKLEQDGYDKKYIGKIGSFVFSDILEQPLIRTIRPTLEAHARTAFTNPNKNRYVTDRILETAFHQNSPMIIDYHMDHEKYVDTVIAAAKDHGYETILLAPHISAETFFPRIKKRAENTGRPYDLKVGLETHKGFAERLDHYIKHFDLSIFLSNEQNHAPLKPIAITTPHSMEILDEREYQAMRQKTHINTRATAPADLYATDLQHHPDGNLSADKRGMEGSNRENNATGKAAIEGEFVKKIRTMVLGNDSDHAIGHASSR